MMLTRVRALSCRCLCRGASLRGCSGCGQHRVTSHQSGDTHPCSGRPIKGVFHPHLTPCWPGKVVRPSRQLHTWNTNPCRLQQVSNLIENHLKELQNKIEQYFPALSTRVYDWVRDPFSESSAQSENLTLREVEEL